MRPLHQLPDTTDEHDDVLGDLDLAVAQLPVGADPAADAQRQPDPPAQAAVHVHTAGPALRRLDVHDAHDVAVRSVQVR